MNLLRIYVKTGDFFTAFLGFSLGNSFHIVFTSVIFVSGFAYGYIVGTINNPPNGILIALLVGLFIAITIHYVMYGGLSFMGIPSVVRDLNVLNKAFKGNKIPENLPQREYSYYLKLLNRFGLLRMFFAIVDVILVLGVVLIWDFAFLKSGHSLQFIITGIICAPIHMQFSYIVSDLNAGRYRAIIKRKMYERGYEPPNYHLFSLKTKFALILLIIVLAGYILTTLLRSDVAKSESGVWYIAFFSIFALFLLISLAILYFSSIFISIKELQMAARSLQEGNFPELFSKTSDLELANLSSGFFHAAQQVLAHQRDLEKRIAAATRHLTVANDELRKKDHELQIELNFAADIQKSIVPEIIHPWNGLAFAGAWLPMGKVSGDYFDVFRFKNHAYVLITDVSGHGVPAALITMAAKQSFSVAVTDGKTPADVFKAVNEELVERINTQDYLTAFMMKIDDEYNFTYSNASHQKAIHYSVKTNDIKLYDTGGLFIGAMPEASESYENGHSGMKDGDRIYLYTDGINEHTNEKGEDFGHERLIEIIRETKDLKIEESVREIIQKLRVFMGNSKVRDDISVLAMELNPEWTKFISFYNTGVLALKNNQLDKAENTLMRAIELSPRYPRLNYMLGRVLFLRLDYLRSAMYLEQYLQDTPGDIRGLQLMVTALIKTEEISKAQMYFRRLKQIDPGNIITQQLQKSLPS